MVVANGRHTSRVPIRRSRWRCGRADSSVGEAARSASRPAEIPRNKTRRSPWHASRRAGGQRPTRILRRGRQGVPVDSGSPTDESRIHRVHRPTPSTQSAAPHASIPRQSFPRHHPVSRPRAGREPRPAVHSPWAVLDGIARWKSGRASPTSGGDLARFLVGTHTDNFGSIPTVSP